MHRAIVWARAHVSGGWRPAKTLVSLATQGQRKCAPYRPPPSGPTGTAPDRGAQQRVETGIATIAKLLPNFVILSTPRTKIRSPRACGVPES